MDTLIHLYDDSDDSDDDASDDDDDDNDDDDDDSDDSDDDVNYTEGVFKIVKCLKLIWRSTNKQ